MPAIFISYRKADSKAWATSLGEHLASRFGDDQVFLDKEALTVGSWQKQIDKALADCRVMIVVIGPQWLTIADERGCPRIMVEGDVHRREVACALSRSDVTVIPVRVDRTAMPGRNELPSDLQKLVDQQSREYADTKRHREVDLALLVKDIEKITGLVAKPLPGSATKEDSTWVRTVTTWFLLSILLWVLYFYFVSVGAPPTPGETSAIVLFSLVITLVLRKYTGRK